VVEVVVESAAVVEGSVEGATGTVVATGSAESVVRGPPAVVGVDPGSVVDVVVVVAHGSATVESVTVVVVVVVLLEEVVEAGSQTTVVVGAPPFAP